MSEEVATQQAPVDIASALAKDGIKTDDSPVIFNEPVRNNIEAPVIQEPLKEQEAPKTETVEQPPVPEAEKPIHAAAPSQPPAQQAPVEVNWKEVLKKQPEVEVLKEIGLDEKMINFLNRWRGGEDMRDYLEAITADYTKMSPEELMRRQLVKEYGSLIPSEQFEELYAMKVTEQYKLDKDVYDEKEMQRGRMLLTIDAEKVRQEFIRRQQELLLSKPPAHDNSQADLAAQAEQQQRQRDIDSYRNMVETSPYTKDLLTSRLLKVGDGEKAFNLEVANPQNLLDLLYDPAKWSQKLWNTDGTPNIRKQLLISAIADDDIGFFTNLSKHYETLGAKKVIEPIENPSPPPNAAPARNEADVNDPIAQLARFGKITSAE
jgi:hypothetical protein